MAKTTRRQRKKTGRVMHEFKHGELKRGRGGGKVKSRKQAVAIALSEAGASKKQNGTQKRKARAKTARKSKTARKPATRRKTATRKTSRKSTKTTRKTKRR